ncbi:MAG: hypothetical protein QXV73_05195 [Candidatus Micrarchaeia archaeon]
MYCPVFISDPEKKNSGWFVAKKINDDELEILKEFGKFDSREQVYLFIEAIEEAKDKSIFKNHT